MEALRKRPLFSTVHRDPRQFRPASGSSYIYGLLEERSEHIEHWLHEVDISPVKVLQQSISTVTTDLAGVGELSLRDKEGLLEFIHGLKGDHLYIDITGLSHPVWAPLIKTALEVGRTLTAIYVEPESYQANANPRKGEIFDLSERIEGIAPIPLFASLSDSVSERTRFVPLLGFEGTRLAYMIEQVEPEGGRMTPIVGVPGFQIEFPFFAFLGNQPQLAETQAWKNVRYAKANCPFSLYYELEDILRLYPDDHIKVAPIGTKPHALGAVLFAAEFPQSVELIYDHPRRKVKRTAGSQTLHEYSVSAFSEALKALRGNGQALHS